MVKRTILFPVIMLLVCICLPALVSADGSTIEGHHRSISAVPAPGPVTIDGKLDDWDLSGEILTYENPDFAEKRHARTALMYDKNYFYVSAFFKDSSPMHHLADGKVDATLGWDGDCLQIRLNTDPSVGYPMQLKEPKPIGRDVDIWYCDAPGRNEPQMSVSILEFQPNGEMRFQQMHNYYGTETETAFQKQQDGYTLEARLPWQRLGMTGPPMPGTKLAFTTQHLWANDAGTHYGTSINDVNAPGGGFTYASTAGWGYLLFEPKGRLARAREEIPKPVEMAKTLSFTYTLPEAGKVSIGVFNAKGELVRTLLTANARPAGAITEKWDGLNDFGDVLPAGNYAFKALTSKGFKQEWVVSAKNAGTPPWETTDGTGSWGQSPGMPADITCAGDRIYLLWKGGEGGNNLQGCTLEGKKLWGNIPYANNSGFADALVTDGKSLYIAQATGVSQHSAATGLPLNFPGERRIIEIPGGGITDLAVLDGHLYVLAKGHVSDIQLDTAQIVRTLTVGDGASGLKVAPGGKTLLCLRDGALCRLHPDSGAVDNLFPVELGKPFSLAVSPDGKRVYVSDQGRLQMDIRVYSYPDGKPLGVIGKPGGRPAIGKFDPNGLFMPGRMAFDAKGRLWVAEMDMTPNRFSVWAPSGNGGKLVKDFLGPCVVSNTAFVDREQPKYLYVDNTRWIIDYDKRTAKIDCTYARPGWNGPQPASSSWTPSRVVHAQGRTFLLFPYDVSGLSAWEMLDDHAVPLYATARLDRAGWPVKQEEYAYKYICYWSDINRNGIMDASEMENVRPAEGQAVTVPSLVTPKEERLAFEEDGGKLLGVKEWRNGLPVWYRDYEVKAGIPTAVSNWPSALNPDRTRCYVPETNDGYYTNDMRKNGIACYTADGKKLWRFKAGIGMDASAPITKFGEVRGAQKIIGFIETGADKGGEIVGVNGYWGDFNLLNEDGLFVTELCQDNRRGAPLGPDYIQCENFNGVLYRHPKTGKVYLLGGDIDARIWEISGFDAMKRFNGTLEITPQNVQTATRALTDYLQAVGTRVTRFTLARMAAPPTLDGSLASWDLSQAVKIDAGPGHGGKALAAYDDKYLYLAYRVVDDSPFVNKGGEAAMLFKTGDLVDVILCTQAGADLKRAVGKGDTRIMFAPFQGKPVAVVIQKVAQGGTAAPFTYTSSQLPEAMERVAILRDARVAVKITPDGYLLEAAVPLSAIGFTPEKGKEYPFDFGILYGDPGGIFTTLRAYWTNQDTQITNDTPTESRIQPANLGTGVVE